MDETSLGANRTFKVIRDCSTLPLRIDDGKLPHLTACVAFNPCGYVVKPMVILPNLAKIKSLCDLTTDCLFTTSQTGWITKRLFLAYAIHFITEMSYYRELLPESIRKEKILLIVDGHSSRFNLKVLCLLRNHGVDVLVLPPHCTHCLQPFDVGVASSLKSHFKSNLGASYKNTFLMFNERVCETKLEQECQDYQQKLTADLLRYTMVSCFIDALRASTTKKKCFSSFRKCGLFPLNKEEPLSSHYTISNAPKHIQNRIRETNHGSQGIITDDIYLQSLIDQSNESFTNDSCDLDPLVLAEDLIIGPKKSGKIISPLRPFYEVADIANDDNKKLKKGFTRISLSVQTYFD